MRRLLLLRHAKAERSQPGGRNQDRVLATRGRADTKTLGAYLARHAFIPDRAVVSTAARTRETWTLLAAAMGKTPPVSFEERLYDASPETILQAIKTATTVEELQMVISRLMPEEKNREPHLTRSERRARREISLGRRPGVLLPQCTRDR